MNFKSLILSTLAVAALAACTKENNVTSQNEEDTNYAYLAINVVPTTPATRSDGPGQVDGTEAESYPTTINVVTFNDAYEKLGVYSLADLTGTDAFKVSALTTKILVVVNADNAVSSALSSASTFSDLNAAITEDVSNITGDNNFLMVSSGEKPGDHGLTTVEVYSTKDEAQLAANRFTVKVDRVAAKVTLNSATFSADTAIINGWMLDATNTKYYPYSERVNYSEDSSASIITCYRQDPNYTDLVASGDYTTEFNWYTNADEVSNILGGTTSSVWYAVGNSLYCHENTMNAASQLYGNTTKALVKAQYVPKALRDSIQTIEDGTGYFRIEGKLYTLYTIKYLYDSLSTVTSDSNYAAAMVAYMNAFATRMAAVVDSLNTNVGTSLTWSAGSFDEMTLTELNAIPNVGYFAKTVSSTTGTQKYKGVIDYFPNCTNYYYVNINHDYRVEEMQLGRWGVVRNNWYTLQVNRITGTGYPYIPDPTDTNTPDPDPDTPDDEYGYIAVDITVNPWTTWTQDVDL
jgi:hypothetical protein